MVIELCISLFYVHFATIYNTIKDLHPLTYAYLTLRHIVIFWFCQGKVSGWILAFNLLGIWCYYIRIYSMSLSGVFMAILGGLRQLLLRLLSSSYFPPILQRAIIYVLLTCTIHAEFVNVGWIMGSDPNIDLLILIFLFITMFHQFYIRTIQSSYSYNLLFHTPWLHRKLYGVYVEIDHWIYIKYLRTRYPHQRQSQQIDSRKLQLQAIFRQQ